MRAGNLKAGRVKLLRTQRGMTLTELMVALLLNLVVVAGLATTYLQLKNHYRAQATLNELHEEGQYALQQIADELRHAGFWGNIASTTLIQGTSPPLPPSTTCVKDSRWGRVVEQPLFGLNDALSVPNKYNYTDCIPRQDYLRGDIVVVRYVTPEITAPATINDTQNRQRLFLTASLTKGALFQGKDYAANQFNLFPQATHAVNSHAYYIGPSAVDSDNFNCTPVAPYPALFRKTLTSNGTLQREELVRGVEELQLLYGIDTTSDGAVDRYVNADGVSDWRQVVSVRFWLLLRSACEEPGPTIQHAYTLGDSSFNASDRYRRVVMTRSIALHLQ